MTATATPLDLEFEVHGTGEPVLFVSGLNDDRHSWDATVADLQGYRSVVFDNRDVGASPYSSAPYTIADMALDSLRVLDHAGIGSTHIVGHSMGGLIAQEMALIAPERVLSLTLEGTFSYVDPYLSAVSGLWGTWSRNYDRRDFIRSASLFWFGHSIIEEMGLEALVDLIEEAVNAQPVDAFNRQLAAFAEFDSRARIGRIACPTLIVTGEEDKYAVPKYGEGLMRGIPHSRLVTVKRAGHTPHAERPESFNPVLFEFIGQVTSLRSTA